MRGRVRKKGEREREREKEREHDSLATLCLHVKDVSDTFVLFPSPAEFESVMVTGE